MEIKTTDEQISKIFNENKLVLERKEYNTKLKRFLALEKCIINNNIKWVRVDDLIQELVDFGAGEKSLFDFYIHIHKISEDN